MPRATDDALSNSIARDPSFRQHQVNSRTSIEYPRIPACGSPTKRRAVGSKRLLRSRLLRQLETVKDGEQPDAGGASLQKPFPLGSTGQNSLAGPYDSVKRNDRAKFHVGVGTSPERKSVTSEVAGSRAVVPTIPFLLYKGRMYSPGNRSLRAPG